MKVKSAKKRVVSSKTATKNIFESSQKTNKEFSGVDLIDVEVVSTPSNNNSSGRMELSVSSLPPLALASVARCWRAVASVNLRK